jgi:hypothetical protein
VDLINLDRTSPVPWQLLRRLTASPHGRQLGPCARIGGDGVAAAGEAVSAIRLKREVVVKILPESLAAWCAIAGGKL